MKRITFEPMKSGTIVCFFGLLSLAPAITLADPAVLFSSDRYYSCDIQLLGKSAGRVSATPVLQQHFEGVAHQTTGALASHVVSRNGDRLEQVIIGGNFCTADGGFLRLQAYQSIFVFGRGMEREQAIGTPISIQGEGSDVADLGNFLMTARCQIVHPAPLTLEPNAPLGQPTHNPARISDSSTPK